MKPEFARFFCCTLLLTAVITFPCRSHADTPDSIVNTTVFPSSVTLDGPHARQQLLIDGAGHGGSTFDLTNTARYQSQNARIARVDSQGVAMPVADGRTTI